MLLDETPSPSDLRTASEPTEGSTIPGNAREAERLRDSPFGTVSLPNGPETRAFRKRGCVWRNNSKRKPTGCRESSPRPSLS